MRSGPDVESSTTASGGRRGEGVTADRGYGRLADLTRALDRERKDVGGALEAGVLAGGLVLVHVVIGAHQEVLEPLAVHRIEGDADRKTGARHLPLLETQGEQVDRLLQALGQKRSLREAGHGEKGRELVTRQAHQDVALAQVALEDPADFGE